MKTTFDILFGTAQTEMFHDLIPPLILFFFPLLQDVHTRRTTDMVLDTLFLGLIHGYSSKTIVG
jgi:hypothetical protein